MNTITQTIKTLALATILSFGISFAYAWTAPTVAPTGGNTAAPLNTSSTDQTKVGGVTFGGNIGANAMAISNAAANALQVVGGATFGGNVTVGGSSVCRQNGTNCPASSGVSGSGTASYLPQWSSASALGNSTISDNGSYYTMTSRGLYVPNSWVIANDLRSRAGYVYMGGSDLNAIQGTDSWLRLNQQSQFGSGVYTPTLMRADGGFQVDGNQVIDPDAGWHRTYGNTGWYNGTYCGGWYMQDSTWIRSYCSKPVYMDNNLAVAGNVGIGTTDPGVANAKLFVVASGASGVKAVFGSASAGYGVYGATGATGVAGIAGTGPRGVYGTSGASSYSAAYGVYGYSSGVLNGIDYGVYGQARDYGVYGTATDWSSYGVYGKSDLGTGVYGYGNSIYYDFYAAGPGVNYGAGSSIRWKENIKLIDNPLDKINKLRGVYFDWKEDKGGKHDIGMIAEEVRSVLPEIVQSDKENPEYAEGMDYSKLTPLLVEAIKEQQKEIDILKNQLKNLNK